MKYEDVAQLIWFGSAAAGLFCFCISMGYQFGPAVGWLLASGAFAFFTISLGREIRDDRRSE